MSGWIKSLRNYCLDTSLSSKDQKCVRISNEQLMIFWLSSVSTQWVLSAKNFVGDKAHIMWPISYGQTKCAQTLETNLERRFGREKKVGKTLDMHVGQIYDSMPHTVCNCERNRIRIMILLTIFSLKLCSILTFFAAYHFKWPLLLCNSPPIYIVDWFIRFYVFEFITIHA